MQKSKANFVSMMPMFEGIMEFDYMGMKISIPYKMDNLGGSPHIYFTDKNNWHHVFFYLRSDAKWYYGYNFKPKWPAEFMYSLHRMMDMERERHGLK